MSAPYRFVRRRRSPQSRVLLFFWRLFLAFVKISLALILLAVLAIAGLYFFYARDLLASLPDPAAIGQRRQAETTQIYARDGTTLLYELVDPQGGRRTVVGFERIPQVLKDATIAVEDANFYQNPGVDIRGVLRAIWLNYQAQEVVSGGSTVTQQLVRNVLMTPEERNQQTFERKVREAILAYKVTNQYSKDQILGIYLNEVYYGNQAYGVEAAAEAYFGKHVWELSLPEATLIAGLPQSPTTLDPFTNFAGAKQRQKVVLDLMVKYNYLSAQQATDTYNTDVPLVRKQTDLVAPHFVFYIRQLLEQHYGPDVMYGGGLRVVTSLDIGWQTEAQRIVRQRVGELRDRNASNGAAVILSDSNEILAMVGSADYNDPSIDGEVNVALAPRQPGSALKPVAYAAAMRRGWTPATVLWDEPTQFKLDNGQVYEPRNYDDSWHGPQRVRMALANSLNIPAVKAMEYVGVENFVEQAHTMGITTLNDPAQYGLAMVLGAGEVRLLDLTNVYSTFRNGGKMREPIAILKVTDSRGAVLESQRTNEGRQVLGTTGEQISYLITSILSDNVARWYMFGRGNVMELPDGRPAAVKTGTSNEWRDAWAIGYTPEVVVGVWVGNSDNTPMQEIAGVNGAGVIWRDIMDSFNQGRPVRQFKQPAGIATAKICADTGALAATGCASTLDEVFVAGSEPKMPDVAQRTIRVAGDGTCLPASYTPPSEIREQTFAVYPPEFQDWATRQGIPQPPTKVCPPPAAPTIDAAIAQISEPSVGAVITKTQVLVNGAAQGAYVLEYGNGDAPTQWQQITASNSVGGETLLGIWFTDGLANSTYTLRLTVTTRDGVPVESRRQVRVQR